MLALKVRRFCCSKSATQLGVIRLEAHWLGRFHHLKLRPFMPCYLQTLENFELFALFVADVSI
ncbi:hypothetical protein [Polynucleobacter asymbioticus]|uniref:hypothetical protein n=1 Tax=Polynucleobacter asymbioticus TaxID=576611 RepID=UPI0012374F08|nr:hypothetical protein [Polynucleobacter asymbioticus]